MARPRRGKVVAIDAGVPFRWVHKPGTAKSPQSGTHDQSDAWHETVDALADFVWTWARAAQTTGHSTEDVFRTAWLRFADHFMDVPDHAVEAWLQQTVARERTRMTALRTRRLGLVPAPDST